MNGVRYIIYPEIEDEVKMTIEDRREAETPAFGIKGENFSDLLKAIIFQYKKFIKKHSKN